MQIFNRDGIKIVCGDCRSAIRELALTGAKPNIVLTSPPYNTNPELKPRKKTEANAKHNFSYICRYDEYQDRMSLDEYNAWTLEVFDCYDSALDRDGVVLYNLSYGSQNPSDMWHTVSCVAAKSPFMVADCIVWKKPQCLMNNSRNKLSRIVEFVFVLCRRDEIDTFRCNKPVVRKNDYGTNKIYFKDVNNYIEAASSDGYCELNHAAYSTELCRKLLNIYALPGDTVLDSFSGTGTTLVAAWDLGLKAVGIELSQKQCEYAADRLRKAMSQPKMFAPACQVTEPQREEGFL